MDARRQAGFSLLEAIVALAILASVGMALFAAMNQSLGMVAKAERVRERESALRNAVAWMQVGTPVNLPPDRTLIWPVGQPDDDPLLPSLKPRPSFWKALPNQTTGSPPEKMPTPALSFGRPNTAKSSMS